MVNEKVAGALNALGQADTRRFLARMAWLYLFLLVLATVTLGVFCVAFVASLKEDALTNPTELSINQLQPSSWKGAWSLGNAGADDAWFGGLAPGRQVVFEVTYANQSLEQLVEPVVRIPKRRGSLAQPSVPEASAQVAVGTLQLLREKDQVLYDEVSGTKVTPRQGVSRTWRFTLHHRGATPFDQVPMVIEVPKGQVLIESTLPASRIERRGRVASWQNAVPGLLTYVFGNYVRVIDDARSLATGESLFMSWTFNSFFIAVFKVVLTLIIACLGGYALARFQFPGSRLIFYTMLFSMMVPGQVLFISNYLVFRDIGLLNTPWAVITAVVASAQVLIMKQFFEGIPREIEEAAIVDGANPFTILTTIFLPLSRPALASVTILGFQGAWNDFFWPLVVLTSPAESYTLPVGLLSLRNVYGIAGDWGMILAGSFLSTIPVLLIFIFFQRYFVENDTSSAVKG
jgi:multiple sugar transport system permease protein